MKFAPKNARVVDFEIDEDNYDNNDTVHLTIDGQIVLSIDNSGITRADVSESPLSEVFDLNEDGQIPIDE